MKYYEAAAKWWADNLREVDPRGFRNGDESSVGGINMALATTLAGKGKPCSEEIDVFEKRLSEAIEENVEMCERISLGTDYIPYGTLAEVAMETGIKLYCFPWKTTMHISKDEVSVRAGYGAEMEIIFP